MIKQTIVKGNKVTIKLELDTCDFCGCMVVRNNYMDLVDGKAIKLEFKTEIGDNVICIDCAEKHDYKVKCELCEKRVHVADIKMTFGVNCEFLCNHCYETVPAKVWDEKVEEMHEHYTSYI